MLYFEGGLSSDDVLRDTSCSISGAMHPDFDAMMIFWTPSGMLRVALEVRAVAQLRVGVPSSLGSVT